MQKAFLLLAMCFMMTLSLQAAGFFLLQDGPQARGPVDIALRPEWHLRPEEQTEWWRFPRLSAAPQHNAAFILQLSYQPIGRTRQ